MPAREFVRASSDQLTLGLTSTITALPVTMSVWMRTNQSLHQTVIRLSHTTGSGMVQVFLHPTGSTRLQVRDDAGTTTTFSGGPGYSVGVWHHIVGRFTGGSAREIFVNGEKRVHSLSHGAITLNQAHVGFDTNQYLDGLIAEPCFWDVGLTDEQIGSLYRGVPYWQVEHRQIIAAPDMHGLYDRYQSKHWTSNNPGVAEPIRLGRGTHRLISVPQLTAGVTVDVSSSISTTSGVSAVLSPLRGVSGTVAATSSLAATANATRNLSLSVAASTATTVVVGELRWLSGTFDGTSTTSAVLTTSSLTGSVVSQSVVAAFPDQPVPGGSGLLVTMGVGSGGDHIEHDCGVELSILHTRVLFNPVDANSGTVALLVGLDLGSIETFRAIYDTDTRVLDLKLATGESITHTLLAGLPWHCIEIRIDSNNGQAELWINGESAGTLTGSFGALATRRLRLGAVFKDISTNGQLYLDEWLTAVDYIGPVVVDPVSPHANDPARWLVLFNTSEADSVTWAEGYRQARGIPFANLLGLNLSTAETIDTTQWLSLFNAIESYLTRNRLADSVLGLLLGYRVPGYVDFGGSGLIDSVPALLHHTSTTPLSNPLSVDGTPTRPTKNNLSGFRLTARIDGLTLADADALVSRADTIISSGLGDGASSTVWLDPYTTPGPGTDPHIVSMSQWAGSVDRMRTRLPLQLSAATDPQQEVQFGQIQDDGFFWGWSEAAPSTGFFGTTGGDRVFCFQLHTISATAPTLRSGSANNWAGAAIVSGYASVAGSSRPYSVSAVPLVRPFFEGLRQGWTLGEAWFVANPVPGEGLFLVGDPLMTVKLPQAGWDIFGPFARLEEADPSMPSLALREDELSASMTGQLLPIVSDEAVYLIRHVDQSGRSEAGTRVVRVQNVTGQAMLPPLAPVWPDVAGWRVPIEDGLTRPSVAWERAVDTNRVQTVDLEGEIDGGPAQVLQSITPMQDDRSIELPQGLPGQSVRYRWVIHSTEGASMRTPWSEMITPAVLSPVSLQFIEVSH